MATIKSKVRRFISLDEVRIVGAGPGGRLEEVIAPEMEKGRSGRPPFGAAETLLRRYQPTRQQTTAGPVAQWVKPGNGPRRSFATPALCDHLTVGRWAAAMRYAIFTYQAESQIGDELDLAHHSFS
jgi:hypothetical protein